MVEVARLTVKVTGDTGDAEQGLARVNRALQDTSSRAGGALATLGKFGALAAGGALAGMSAVVAKTGVEFLSLQQQSQIAFTTILGDASRARAFMAELSQFAAKTPFELPGLTQAASRLAAVGVETQRIIPLMAALGDATAGMGTGAVGIERAVTALTQMATKGKVTGEEMLQLTEAGIPAWDALAAKLGVDVATAQERVSKGQVKVNELFAALEERSGPAMQRLAGMMDQQSRSFSGLMSTAKDSFAQLSGTVMAPLFERMTAGLQRLTTVLSSPEAQAAAQALADGLAKAFGVIGEVVERAAGPLSQLLSTVREVAPGVRDALQGLFAGLAGSGGEGMFAGLAQALDRLKGAVQSALDGIRGFWESHREQIQTIVEGLATALSKAFAGVAKEVGPTLEAIVSIIERVVGEIRERWSMIEGILGPIITAAVTTVEEALNILSNLIQLAMNLIQGDWEGAWDNVKSILESAWTIIKAVVQAAADAIPAALRLAWSVLGNVAEGAWNAFKQAVAAAWAGIVTTVTTAAGEVVTFLQGLPGQLVAAVGDLGSLLVSAGKDLIAGLIAGIRSMAGALLTAIKEAVVDKIPGFIKDKLGIHSPSAVMAEFGRSIGQGLAAGIDQSVGVVERAVGRLTNIVTSPQGGGGRVVPVSGAGVMSVGGGAVAARLPPAPGAVVVQFHGPVYGVPQFEQAVVDAVRQALRTRALAVS